MHAFTPWDYVTVGKVTNVWTEGSACASQVSLQSCQFGPSVPHELFQESGGFLNFAKIICLPNEAINIIVLQ